MENTRETTMTSNSTRAVLNLFKALCGDDIQSVNMGSIRVVSFNLQQRFLLSHPPSTYSPPFSLNAKLHSPNHPVSDPPLFLLVFLSSGGRRRLRARESQNSKNSFQSQADTEALHRLHISQIWSWRRR